MYVTNKINKDKNGGTSMKILLDDTRSRVSPDANIKGAVNSINKVKAEVVLIGKEEVIRSKVKEFYERT